MSRDPSAIVQTAVDLAAAAREADRILEAEAQGEGAVLDHRIQLGELLRRVRATIPPRGPKAKAWGDFVDGRRLSLDTASRYIKLAEHVAAHPEAKDKGVQAIYEAIGIASGWGRVSRSAAGNLSPALPAANSAPALPERAAPAIVQTQAPTPPPVGDGPLFPVGLGGAAAAFSGREPAAAAEPAKKAPPTYQPILQGVVGAELAGKPLRTSGAGAVTIVDEAPAGATDLVHPDQAEQRREDAAGGLAAGQTVVDSSTSDEVEKQATPDPRGDGETAAPPTAEAAPTCEIAPIVNLAPAPRSGDLLAVAEALAAEDEAEAASRLTAAEEQALREGGSALDVEEDASEGEGANVLALCNECRMKAHAIQSHERGAARLQEERDAALARVRELEAAGDTEREQDAARHGYEQGEAEALTWCAEQLGLELLEGQPAREQIEAHLAQEEEREEAEAKRGEQDRAALFRQIGELKTERDKLAVELHRSENIRRGHEDMKLPPPAEKRADVRVEDNRVRVIAWGTSYTRRDDAQAALDAAEEKAPGLVIGRLAVRSMEADGAECFTGAIVLEAAASIQAAALQQAESAARAALVGDGYVLGPLAQTAAEEPARPRRSHEELMRMELQMIIGGFAGKPEHDDAQLLVHLREYILRGNGQGRCIGYSGPDGSLSLKVGRKPKEEVSAILGRRFGAADEQELRGAELAALVRRALLLLPTSEEDGARVRDTQEAGDSAEVDGALLRAAEELAKKHSGERKTALNFSPDQRAKLLIALGVEAGSLAKPQADRLHMHYQNAFLKAKNAAAAAARRS